MHCHWHCSCCDAVAGFPSGALERWFWLLEALERWFWFKVSAQSCHPSFRPRTCCFFHVSAQNVFWLFVFRCHGCYTLVTDTTRQFCPQCGSGDTLKKVSYTVNDKGETKLYINPKHVIKIKHTKMYLHKPRGGKCGTNKTLVLREDQLRNCGRTYNRDKEDRKLAALWDEVCMQHPYHGTLIFLLLSKSLLYQSAHDLGPCFAAQNKAPRIFF